MQRQASPIPIKPIRGQKKLVTFLFLYAVAQYASHMCWCCVVGQWKGKTIPSNGKTFRIHCEKIHKFTKIDIVKDNLPIRVSENWQMLN